jgi:hypothetical protein
MDAVILSDTETTGGEHHSRGADVRNNMTVTEPLNYDGPQVLVIAIMTSDSRTYVHHNLKAYFPPNRIQSQEYCNITTVYSKYSIE